MFTDARLCRWDLGQLFWSEHPHSPSSCSTSPTALILFIQHLSGASLLHIYKSQMQRANTFSLKSRKPFTNSCRCSYLEGDILRPVRCSTTHRRTQPTSINFCRRCACFPHTKVLYISHENRIFWRVSRLLMPLVRNREEKYDAYLYRCTFIDLKSSPHLGWWESCRRAQRRDGIWPV